MSGRESMRDWLDRTACELTAAVHDACADRDVDRMLLRLRSVRSQLDALIHTMEVHIHDRDKRRRKASSPARFGETRFR